jgi:hypothetical protein
VLHNKRVVSVDGLQVVGVPYRECEWPEPEIIYRVSERVTLRACECA